MAQQALQDDGDKEFTIFRFQEQVSYVVAAQVAVDVEALIKKELDELLSVQLEDGILEHVVLYFDLCVVVALKYFGQSQRLTIPVNSEP